MSLFVHEGLHGLGYRLAGALPGLVLGVLPAVVGLCSGWGALTLFGVLGLGRVIDPPTEVGCRLLPPV